MNMKMLATNQANPARRLTADAALIAYFATLQILFFLTMPGSVTLARDSGTPSSRTSSGKIHFTLCELVCNPFNNLETVMSGMFVVVKSVTGGGAKKLYNCKWRLGKAS